MAQLVLQNCFVTDVRQTDRGRVYVTFVGAEGEIQASFSDSVPQAAVELINSFYSSRSIASLILVVRFRTYYGKAGRTTVFEIENAAEYRSK